VLLSGKKILVTGVLTPQSIAFAVAELCQKEGAEVLLTGFGRAKSLTERSAKRLSPAPEVLELDVGKPEDFKALTESMQKKWGRLDGVLHAVAFAPEDALGGNFLNTPWESVQTAFRISTFSLKELAVACRPLMKDGGSIVTLDFDNAGVAWPIYDWMGVCKAGLGAVVRYLARDLGAHKIRVNAVAAGPLGTIAAKGIPGFKQLEAGWGKQAPLGWSSKDHEAVAKTTVALLSDLMPSTTGEQIHVDGGYHCIGAPPVDLNAEPAGG
jgi:meromycolic acid enoyl-[acyl-carrier-protein] reductase